MNAVATANQPQMRKRREIIFSFVRDNARVAAVQIGIRFRKHADFNFSLFIINRKANGILLLLGHFRHSQQEPNLAVKLKSPRIKQTLDFHPGHAWLNVLWTQQRIGREAIHRHNFLFAGANIDYNRLQTVLYNLKSVRKRWKYTPTDKIITERTEF